MEGIVELFHSQSKDSTVRINIYADEVQCRKCPYTNDDWFYIGIIVENIANELLPEIINLRYCHNFDKTSKYFLKNDRIVHWVDVASNDTRNICNRWLEFILDHSKSEKHFYAYILGINDSKLNKDEFGDKQEFNSKYNRFFRTAVLYAIKCFFPKRKIIVENIFHEQGQQQDHDYFPWHCIYKLDNNDENIICKCNGVTFIPKSHRDCIRSNIIQLCDLFLGVSTTALHGLIDSSAAKYKAELVKMFVPLLKRMVENPKNVNSSHNYANRIMISFFPREKTNLGDVRRFGNQFYTNRKIRYIDQLSGQLSLFG